MLFQQLDYFYAVWGMHSEQQYKGDSSLS